MDLSGDINLSEKRRIVDSLFRRLVPDKYTGCMNWAGALDTWGYGHVVYKKKHRGVHRFVWELVNGPVPIGLFVCHSCDNPKCANINHLFLGSAKDNVQDMIKKNRANKSSGANHWKAKLSEENVKAIRARRAAGQSLKEIAELFTVSPALISLITRNKLWRVA